MKARRRKGVFLQSHKLYNNVNEAQTCSDLEAAGDEFDGIWKTHFKFCKLMYYRLLAKLLDGFLFLMFSQAFRENCTLTPN